MISQAALNACMGNVYLDNFSNMAGRCLDPVSIEHIANGMVDPDTNTRSQDMRR